GAARSRGGRDAARGRGGRAQGCGRARGRRRGAAPGRAGAPRPSRAPAIGSTNRPDGKRMRKAITFRRGSSLIRMAAAALALLAPTAACASSGGRPIDFTDRVLVLVKGRWPQPHMKGKTAVFACLYDKSTGAAEAQEVPS